LFGSIVIGGGFGYDFFFTAAAGGLVPPQATGWGVALADADALGLLLGDAAGLLPRPASTRTSPTARPTTSTDEMISVSVRWRCFRFRSAMRRSCSFRSCRSRVLRLDIGGPG
jgi:hypothetical protein